MGVKMLENCRFPNDRTDVALTLLADRWHGDLVAYVSDYTVLADCEGKGLAQMAEYFPENPRDYVEDHGRTLAPCSPASKDASGICQPKMTPRANTCILTRGR